MTYDLLVNAAQVTGGAIAVWAIVQSARVLFVLCNLSKRERLD